MKRSIYVAYTGGTIGMQRTEQGFAPVAGFLTKHIKSLPEFFREEMPKFTIHEYSPLLDSSDMSPTDWQTIADDIKQNYEKYDGFVILHGTDTMAFTASALAFILQDLSKPVIITGSQIPLSQMRSDGQSNLLNSLYIAANYPISEVSLFFNNTLFRGCRTTKVNSESFDAFASPNYPCLMEAGIHICLKAGEISTDSIKPLNLAAIKPQVISIVTLYPGITASMIENFLPHPTKALILLTYGAGNAPNNPELLACLAEANKRGVILLNITQCLQGKVNMEGYATGNALAQAGVISGFDMTLEAALAKLHYLLSKPYSADQVRAELQKNLVGELSKN